MIIFIESQLKDVVVLFCYDILLLIEVAARVAIETETAWMWKQSLNISSDFLPVTYQSSSSFHAMYILHSVFLQTI